MERIGTSAAELVSFSPDVLLAGNTTTATALQRETRSIPVVFVLVGDPIGSGFVESLARPGGNLTGFISFDPPIAGKQLELLKEIAPSVHRVAFVFNPVTAPYMVHWLQVAQASAASLGTEIVEAHVHNIAEIESAISTQARQPSSGLFVGHAKRSSRRGPSPETGRERLSDRTVARSEHEARRHPSASRICRRAAR